MIRNTIIPLFTAVLMMPGQVNAQYSGEEYSHGCSVLGGYISLGSGFTHIGNSPAITGQFRLAARIGHGFSIGFAGTGFSDRLSGLNYDRPQLTPNGYFYEGGYAGLLLEPVFAPHFPVHLSFPLLIGAGGVVLSEEADYDGWHSFDDDFDYHVLQRDAFMVIEPGVELEINLNRFVRMSAGVGYRFTSAVKPEGKAEHPLDGLSGTLTMKLGVF